MHQPQKTAYSPDWSQEIEEYYRRKKASSLHSAESIKRVLNSRHYSAEEIVNKIDKVESYLVAKLQVSKLFRHAIRQQLVPSKVFDPIRYVLPDQHPEQLSPKMVSAAEELERRMKEGLCGKALINYTIAQVLDQLNRTCNLFELIDNLPDNVPVNHVGAFLVEKGLTGVFRIIINARSTNVKYDKSDSFSLFRVENVIQIIDNLSHQDWFAVNIDLRHWFHEIPLPERYRLQFLLNLEYYSNTGQQVQQTLSPKAAPMGWVKSPIIGQTLTWALILSCLYGTMNYNALDLDTEALSKLESTPRWLPLKSGGGIFVILDNILVVTADREVRDAWFKHLSMNGKECHAIYKVKHDPPIDYENDYGTYVQLLQRQTCFDMTLESQSFFDFSGVTFFQDKHYLAVPNEDKALLVPEGTRPDGSWYGSRRKLASIIGLINWFRRVHNINPANEDTTSRNLRTLYSVVTPPAGSTWSSMLEVPAEWFEGIIATWKLRNSEPRTDARPLNTNLRCPVMIAVDAASSSSLLGFVYYGTGGECRHFSRGYDSRTLPDIAQAELYAIVEGVRYCIAHNEEADLIVLATDNMNAKIWTERGFGKCDITNTLIRELNQLLDTHQVRLYLVYVESKSNSADCPTRYEEISEKRRVETKNVLENGLKEAHGLWKISGERVKQDEPVSED